MPHLKPMSVYRGCGVLRRNRVFKWDFSGDFAHLRDVVLLNGPIIALC